MNAFLIPTYSTRERPGLNQNIKWLDQASELNHATVFARTDAFVSDKEKQKIVAKHSRQFWYPLSG